MSNIFVLKDKKIKNIQELKIRNKGDIIKEINKISRIKDDAMFSFNNNRKIIYSKNRELLENFTQPK